MNTGFFRPLLSLLCALSLALTLTVARADAVRGRPAVDRVHGPLSVMVLGSGGPMLQTSGRASAGYLIFTDGKPRVLMDLGGGVFQRIAQSGAHIGQVNTILLSHLHIDHTADLPAVVKGIYFDGRLQGSPHTAPIQIFGPGTDNSLFPSTSAFVNDLFGTAGIYAYLRPFVNEGLGKFGYTAHDLSPTFQGDSVHTIVDNDGLVIKEIAVDHYEAPAVAYRIEYKGHSIV